MARRSIFKPLALLVLYTALFDSHASLVIRPKPMDDHQHDRRAGRTFVINGYDDHSATLITPDLEENTLNVNQGRVVFRPTGKDNYHALVVKQEKNGVQQTAIRYVYSFGKPTGRSPSELTGYEKSDLEIVPDPLPREHWHYRAGDTAAFVVRFKGVPIASTPVTLATRHASILEAKTDTQGRVLFKIPDDFPQTRPGRDNNRPGELLLHTRLSRAGTEYSTWLSTDYRVDPRHWQDTTLGALVAGGGFLIGAFITGLGFRRNTQGIRK